MAASPASSWRISRVRLAASSFAWPASSGEPSPFAAISDRNFADFRPGGFEFGERDVLFQLQPAGDGEALGKADFESSLAEARVVFERGCELRIREAAGLVHAADGFLDAEACGSEIGVLSADAVADTRQRDDHVRFRAEREGHAGKSEHGQWIEF